MCLFWLDAPLSPQTTYELRAPMLHTMRGFNASKTVLQTILYPLLVMLLLTLLVGLTAYQVTDNWRQSAEKTTQSAAQAVLLTNIRWSLERVRGDLNQHPQQALKTWRAVQQQANMLAQSNPNEAEFHVLQAFMAKDENMARVDMLLGRDFLNVRLDRIRENLQVLGVNSQFVTIMVTVCMLGLGVVLMTITARDLTCLVRELTQSRDLNIRLQEEERCRIAQDLHDGVVQELVGLKRHYSPDKVDAIVGNLRRVCHNLKPQVLEDLGLSAALEFLAEDLRLAGIPDVQLMLDQEGLAQLPKMYELPLFRVAQELFSNVKKHAQATQVRLTIVYNPQESPVLRGYVQDNGVGYSVQQVQGRGMGLAGVRERIQQVGGRLTTDSKPGQGSRFQFQIPVQEQPVAAYVPV
jgi:signal transduction histidine kinase